MPSVFQVMECQKLICRSVRPLLGAKCRCEQGNCPVVRQSTSQANNLSCIFIFFASWQAGLLFCAIKTPGSPSAAWERSDCRPSVGDCRCGGTGDGRREASALPNPLSCWLSSQQTLCRRLRSVPFAEVRSALAQSARLDLIRSFEPESLPQYEVGQSGRAPTCFERHITILVGPILKGRRKWLCSLSLTDAAFPALGSLTGLPGLVSGLSTSRRGPRRPRRSRDADEALTIMPAQESRYRQGKQLAAGTGWNFLTLYPRLLGQGGDHRRLVAAAKEGRRHKSRGSVVAAPVHDHDHSAQASSDGYRRSEQTSAEGRPKSGSPPTHDADEGEFPHH